MPVLWRLYRARHGPGLDGMGGTFADGRWHRQGELVVYFGASAAIVVLERLAYINPDLLPDDLRLGQFDFATPDDAVQVSALARLPDDWIQKEPTTRKIGNRWLRARSSCLLAVPSAILPEETNYVFNPRHAAANSLRLIRERQFSFDPRLI
jgi:RES domain-containing protein